MIMWKRTALFINAQAAQLHMSAVSTRVSYSSSACDRLCAGRRLFVRFSIVDGDNVMAKL